MRIRSFLLLGVVIIAAAVGAWFGRGYLRDAYYWFRRPSVPATSNYAALNQLSLAKNSTTTSTTTKTVINSVKAAADPLAWTGNFPKSLNLAVPFLSQAPTGNWDPVHEEACEEASAIMVNAYYRGRTDKFAPEEGDKAILAMIDFEKKLLGKFEDTTAAETARLIREYYGYKNVLVRPLAKADDIRAALANGHPVIMPAAGKLLGNPFFSNGGPLYHMLVVKGYLANGLFITNDPGTKRGADYVYDPKILLAAAHDWNGGDVTTGKPLMIVILPNP